MKIVDNTSSCSYPCKYIYESESCHSKLTDKRPTGGDIKTLQYLYVYTTIVWFFCHVLIKTGESVIEYYVGLNINLITSLELISLLRLGQP